MPICDPLSYGKLASTLPENASALYPTKMRQPFGKYSAQSTALPQFFRQVAIPEGAVRPSRSDPVVVFLERFLDMFQNRFGIGFRYLGPFAALVNRLPAIMLAIPWKPGFEFDFDAIPISIA